MQGPFSWDPTDIYPPFNYQNQQFFSVPAFDIFFNFGGILRPVMGIMIMYDQRCLHRGSLGFVLTDMLQLPFSFLCCGQW